ncbi:hypothetical protein, partial [Rhizobium bangladeshense]|uniref:hypothetical protein n=1 Tax=Rhizobium bangladeshense TaxID=1138189 RepID=UPI000B0CD0DB
EWCPPPEYYEEIECENIIRNFRHARLNDPGEAIIEFHFGCGADRIEWDDQDFSHMEIAPPIIVSLNFEELGEGRFNAMTPEGIEGLLFRARNKRSVTNALKAALALERHRVAEGYESELHVPEIRKHMNRARNGILASFRAAKWWDD